MSEYPKIEQTKYDKAIGQWRLAVGEILSVFNMYGLDIYIPGAKEELEEVTIQLTKRLRNADVPITLKRKRNVRDK